MNNDTPTQEPAKLEFKMLYSFTEGTRCLVTSIHVKYDSYSRTKNLLQDITIHQMPVDIPEFRMQQPENYQLVQAAIANNADSYYASDEETIELIRHVTLDTIPQDPEFNSIADQVEVSEVKELTEEIDRANKTLMASLIEQMNRCRTIAAEYDRLPDGAGRVGAWMIRGALIEADIAIVQDDVVKILLSHEKLKNIEPDHE